MNIKNIDTDIFKNAYRKGKKAFKEAVEEFNKKSEPVMGNLKENAKEILYEPKVGKLEKEMKAAQKALFKANKEYHSGDFENSFAEFYASKKQREKLQAFQKAEQKYKNFYARQQYAQQAFEKLNS